MAVSVLLLYTSGQIGSTYGEFSTSGQQDSTLELCSVFPGQIEQLLSDFAGHIHSITRLKASLAGHSFAGDISLVPDIGSLSMDELDQTAAKTASQISAAQSDMSTVSGQLSFNSGVWQQILQEIRSAAAILNQIGGYMVNLDPNCLEIRDAEIFRQLQQSVLQSGVLSESLADTLSGIMDYLGSIHTTGSTLPSGNPGRMMLRTDSLGFPDEEPILSFMAKAYHAAPEVSAGLQATYEQLNADLTAALEGLNSSIGSLQNQQAQISDAKVKLLEKAQAAEAERLALEKKKQEEAAEAAKPEDEVTQDEGETIVTEPDSGQAEDGEHTQPVSGDDILSQDQGENGGEPAAELPGPGAAPTPAAPDSSILQGSPVPAAAPALTATPAPPPTAAPITTPVPDNDYNKGGE